MEKHYGRNDTLGYLTMAVIIVVAIIWTVMMLRF